jgi:hypothetical protein
MRHDIRQDYATGLYRVVDTANRNAPLWGEEYANRQEAVRRAKQLDRKGK